MKEHQDKQTIGVWMDQSHAILITPSNDDYTVSEKVKSDEYHGHSGEHASMNADKAHSRKFYQAISHRLLNYDEIYIFGPGKSQEQLRNFLQEDQHFKGKRIALGSADHLTDHQMIAKVRDFFNK